jgi:hypothetical protein
MFFVYAVFGSLPSVDHPALDPNGAQRFESWIWRPLLAIAFYVMLVVSFRKLAVKTQPQCGAFACMFDARPAHHPLVLASRIVCTIVKAPTAAPTNGTETLALASIRVPQRPDCSSWARYASCSKNRSTFFGRSGDDQNEDRSTPRCKMRICRDSKSTGPCPIPASIMYSNTLFAISNRASGTSRLVITMDGSVSRTGISP